MKPAAPLSLVFIGLSLGSSWGNGHATTYRALLKALARRGHKIDFLERDVPWYAQHRDLPAPPFCRLHLYSSLDELSWRYGALLEQADVVVLGSYVPDGVAAGRLVLRRAAGLVGFYDIDTPVTLAKLAASDTEYLSPDLIPQFDFYLSFAGGPCLRQLEEGYGARMARAFYCMVDADLYRATGARPVWDIGYLGTYSADRQPALERLLLEPARRLPHRHFVVAGPQYPEDVDWPRNVDRIDHIPPSGHPAFNSGIKFALNLTRADMRATGWAPSVRLFEAAACGTAILSDRWPGLSQILPDGEALLTVQSPDDIVAVLESVDDGQRTRIAERARQIVLAEHTGMRRAEEFEAIVAGAYRSVSTRTIGQEGHHAREIQ